MHTGARDEVERGAENADSTSCERGMHFLKDKKERTLFQLLMVALNASIYFTSDHLSLGNTLPSTMIILASASHSGYKLYQENQDLSERREGLLLEAEQPVIDRLCQPNKEECMKLLVAVLWGLFGLSSLGLTIGNEFSEINGFNWFFLAATCFIGVSNLGLSLRLHYQNDTLKKRGALTRKEEQENYLKIARPLYKLLKTELETNLRGSQGVLIDATRDRLTELLRACREHITSNRPLSPGHERVIDGQRVDQVIIRELYEQVHETIQNIDRTPIRYNLTPEERGILNRTQKNLQNALIRYFPPREDRSGAYSSAMTRSPNSSASNTATAVAPAVASAAAISRSREDDISPEGFYTATASEEGSNSPDI